MYIVVIKRPKKGVSIKFEHSPVVQTGAEYKSEIGLSQIEQANGKYFISTILIILTVYENILGKA